MTHRSDPLRKIVARDVNEAGVLIDVLGCGHILHERTDAYGPAPATARRRCWKCTKETVAAATKENP